jgi:FAD/FMN-containing dehydrogenase
MAIAAGLRLATRDGSFTSTVRVQGGATLGDLDRETQDMVRNSVGATNYAGLAALKAKYDPTNLFRMNLNITPSA